MNKSELVKETASRTGLSTDQVHSALTAAFSAIVDAVCSEDSVKIRDFGSFESAAYASRKGRNPKTGEELIIPASKRLKFKQASYVSEALNTK